MHENAGRDMADLFSDLRPQSLESFVIFSSSTIGPQSFLALSSSQGETLAELKLNSLNAQAMENLNLLKGCTNISTLLLSESPASETDLENRHNDVYLEVVAWLRECKRLQNISLSHFFNGPNLLTPVLLENDIRLHELNLDGYLMGSARAFHRALVNQQSLQSICLKGEGDDPGLGLENEDILVNSLCRLPNLVDLRLKNISDFFNDDHIIRLAQNLHKLETFDTSGWGLTDKCLGELSNLSFLRSLEFSAYTRFTSNGIMDFVYSLEGDHAGFMLAVLNAEMDCNLPPDEQERIREVIAVKYGGKFDFQVIRGESSSPN